jgi:hypothetical protein
VDGEKVPIASQTPQGMTAAVPEPNTGVDDLVSDRGRDHGFSWARGGDEAARDVDRDAGHLALEPAGHATVDPHSQLNLQRRKGLVQRLGASDGDAGLLEKSDKTVSGGLDLPPAKSPQLLPYRKVMTL